MGRLGIKGETIKNSPKIREAATHASSSMSIFCSSGAVEESPMLHNLELCPAVEQELPSRAGVLSRVYRSLYDSMGVSISSTGLSAFDRVGTRVAHPLLARTLLADSSVSAILPTAQAPIALGLSEQAPFLVARSGLLMLPPVLLGNSSALAAATRWGLGRPISLVHPRCRATAPSGGWLPPCSTARRCCDNLGRTTEPLFSTSCPSRSRPLSLPPSNRLLHRSS